MKVTFYLQNPDSLEVATELAREFMATDAKQTGWTGPFGSAFARRTALGNIMVDIHAPAALKGEPQ